MNFNNLKLKITHFIVIFIVAFISGIVMYNAFFIFNNKVSRSSISKVKQNNISEISLVPINTEIKDNAFIEEVKNYDIKLAILSKNDSAASSDKIINSADPTVITGNSAKINKYNSSEKYRFSDENNICETFLDKNKFAYIYADGNDLNISRIKNLHDTILNYSKKNYAVIVFIDSKKAINSMYLSKLCSGKASVILTKGSGKSSFELNNNCLVIYDSPYYNKSYTPLIDLVFDNNIPVSIGVKIFVHDQSKKQQVLNDIKSGTKNMTKELEESFVFFEIY